MTTPFLPGATTSVAAGTSSGTAAVDPGAAQVRLHNAGSATVFVVFGAVATTSDMPLPAGAIEVLSKPAGVTTVAAITASGTATLYVTSGVGV